MTVYEVFHYFFLASILLSLLFYKKKQSHDFGTALTFWFILLAFLGLVFSYISANLSNSHVASAPFFYQVSGTWSNHEGSLLLWSSILAFYSFLLWKRPKHKSASCHVVFVLNFSKKSLRPALPPIVNYVYHNLLITYRIIPIFFAIFLVASSDPFLRSFSLCTEPLAEFNPVLQDPVLAIHPPFIYAGVLASAMVFVLSISRMRNTMLSYYMKTLLYATAPFSFNSSIYSESREVLRVWLLASWVFLTAGIALGSWWAYHELGWGGWWFWDPVENASFLPWVLVTAAIHSVNLPKLEPWTLPLSISAFLSVVLGTFAVRSGLLSSVHSFASADSRGFFLGWFFLFLASLSLALLLEVKRKGALQ